MHQTRGLLPVAAFVMASLSTSSFSAQPLPLTNASFKTLSQQYQLVKGSQKSLTNLPHTLVFVQEHTDNNKIIHTRLQQHYQGVMVHGGYAILHSTAPAESLLANQKPVRMNGLVYQDLENDLGPQSAEYIKNAHEALQQFKAQFANEVLSEEQATPLIYLDKNNRAHWAYKVSVLIHYDNKIPARQTAIVDAQSFKPYVQWNDIKTVTRDLVLANGYGGNEKSGKVVYGKDLPSLLIKRSRLLGVCSMENNEVMVVDVKHFKNCPSIPMKFKCNSQENASVYWTGYESDGYDEINGAYSPTNDALYAGNIIKHLYEEWYGVQVLTQSNGKPMKLKMCVHYGRGFQNAFWDGRQMTFGDGQNVLYPLVSLGIAAHEVSHGFTEQNADLEYYEESGGLNESFSDMASQAAEFYAQGNNTWIIGSEIMKEGAGQEALRFMDQPSRDGMSIDSADDYYSGLDVHFSSGVYNRFFYLLATSPNWDTRRAFDVMVKANMDYWTPNSTFEEAACGVIEAARDFNYSTEEIKKHLHTVAINYDQCPNRTS